MIGDVGLCACIDEEVISVFVVDDEVFLVVEDVIFVFFFGYGGGIEEVGIVVWFG